MNNKIKFLLAIGLIVLFSYYIFKVSLKYKIQKEDVNIECNIIAKGCEESVSVCTANNNIYVAFKNQIKCLDKDGKEKTIYKNTGEKIEDLAYCNNALFFISNNKLVKFDLESKEVVGTINNIPGVGKESKRAIISDKNSIYISIGTVTNSGISDNNQKDLTPIDITLVGENYNNTGAFKEVGQTSYKNEVIKKSEIGNGAIYKINESDLSYKLFASGIHNVAAMDINSKGEMIAIFSGMKDEGIRPIKGDKDYIYKVKEGNFYGWPDYSGGDPVDSPRFRNKENKLMKNYPQYAMYGLVYQDKNVNNLESLCIDSRGRIFRKDSYLYWDKKEQMIKGLVEEKYIIDILKLNNKSQIKKIISQGNKFIVLDSGVGCIYTIEEKTNNSGFYLNKEIIIFLCSLGIGSSTIIIYKYKVRRKEK